MTETVKAENYALTLEPDLSRFTFSGTVIINLTAGDPVDAIRLDAAELAVWQCRFSVDGADAAPEACSFTLDPAREGLTVHLPRPVSGPFQLTIDYAGKINDRMAGFYRSRIQAEGAPDHIAVTQFQESDARRAFPCFDHPAKKAVFTVSLIIPENLTAISNTDVQTSVDLDGHRRQVTFAPTPSMSTYLLFFGVGPFEIHTDEKDPRVRAVCLPGMGEQTVFGREFGRQALAYGEDYYAIDYPLSKMDLIAVPDFAFGAMENWGAITFRENLLLHVPGVTSREGEGRICEVIAHEITHQWFGNLVTPEDWRYLWLNESFATYFGYGMVDHYHADWEIWQQFVRSQTETAMTRDALQETFAIEMPGGAQVAITTSTAPIIYSKGGSILRQLEAWIGPEHFQAGLRHYLNRFTYGCAASHHLWESLAETSGMPVDRLMQSWVTQPGFPVITASRRGDRLVLSQKRFSYLPGESGSTWVVPLTVTIYGADDTADTRTVIFDQEKHEIPLPPDTRAYKLNADQTGFYHTAYDDAQNLATLGEMVKARTLGTMDRWGLQNDLYALVKSGAAGMQTYLQMAGNYVGETDYLPLSSLEGHLFEAFLLLQGDIRERIARTADQLADAALAAIGEVPRADESQTRAMLRDGLMVHGAHMGNRRILALLTDQFDQFLKGADIAPDIFRAVMTAGAVIGDQTALTAMINRLEASRVEHERMTLVASLGSFSQWDLLERGLDYALERVPDRIRFLPLMAAAGNPVAGDRLWSWFEDHVDRMKSMHPLLFERVVAAFVPGPGLVDPDRTTAFCKGLLEKQTRLKDVLALSLERLSINAAFRRREL